jgi:hypothetical protein
VAEEDTLNGARSQVEENGCLEATTPLNAKTETKEFFTAEKYTVLLFS